MSNLALLHATSLMEDGPRVCALVELCSHNGDHPQTPTEQKTSALAIHQLIDMYVTAHKHLDLDAIGYNQAFVLACRNHYEPIIQVFIDIERHFLLQSGKIEIKS